MAVLAKSQNRQKTILLLSDSLILDSQIIVLHSVIVSSGTNVFLENIDFRINYSNQSFINLKIPKPITLLVQYSSTNFDFKKIYQNKNPKIIDKEGIETKNPFLYNPNETDFLNAESASSGLKMNGSISRGLGLGNVQNVVVKWQMVELLLKKY